jgi:hypothetical protein
MTGRITRIGFLDDVADAALRASRAQLLHATQAVHRRPSAGTCRDAGA